MKITKQNNFICVWLKQLLHVLPYSLFIETIFKIIFDRHVVYLRCDACSLDLPL